MAESSAGIGRRNRFIICSWNVEGLTDTKIEEISLYMRTNSIDIVCIQEQGAVLLHKQGVLFVSFLLESKRLLLLPYQQHIIHFVKNAISCQQ